jgi:Protein of unknown function, DUF547
MHSFATPIAASAPRVFRLMLAASLALLALGGAARAETPQDLFATAAAGSRQTVDHSAWDRLLKTYVKPGPDGINRVDYASFKRSGQQDLKAYIRALEAVDPATLDRPEQFALLANLYNATTVDIVLDHYPVKSIKDISLGGGLLGVFASGPWKAKVLQMKGVALSLDDIEHGILRPIFKDRRVHYAVNCASIGCPNLRAEAFTGAKLEAQLDAAARAYINSKRGADPRPDGLVVSSLYDWYQKDFGGSEAGVIAHLKRYAEPGLAHKLAGTTSIADYAYDWSLNDIKR